MKILHIEAGKHLYGGAKQVELIITGLTEKGVENHLICPKGSAIVKACSKHATVHEIDYPHELSFKALRQMKQIMQQLKPDIAHLHSRRGADTLGALAAKFTGTPCVLSRRVDNPEASLAIKLKYPLYQQVICISQGIADVLISQGVPKEKINVVHSSIPTAFYQNPKPRKEFNQTFSVDNDDVVIAVVAQLIQRKGHHYLLNILPEILKTQPNVKVLFFGKGPTKDALQASIKEQGLERIVQLAGFRDDLQDWFGCFDFLVHPAEAEGLGVSLLQTGAAKTPIIATAVGGIPEIIIDQQTGWLIPPKDETALQAAILDALASDQKREKLASHLQKHVESHFSVPAMIEGNLRVYQSILSS